MNCSIDLFIQQNSMWSLNYIYPLLLYTHSHCHGLCKPHSLHAYDKIIYYRKIGQHSGALEYFIYIYNALAKSEFTNLKVNALFPNPHNSHIPNPSHLMPKRYCTNHQLGPCHRSNSSQSSSKLSEFDNLCNQNTSFIWLNGMFTDLDNGLTQSVIGT